MINLASAVMLVILGVVLCTAIKKSPQTKWRYSGQDRKKLDDDFLGKLTKDIAKYNDNFKHRNIRIMDGDKCNHYTFDSRVLG